MRLFKRTIQPSFNDKAAKGIAGFLIRAQTKFADGMNKIISGISVKRIKAGLVLFCLCWGGLSGYFLFIAIFNKKQTPVKIESINIPQHINKTGEEQTGGAVEEQTHRQIQAYKKYMDSAQLAIRPGLLDSMNVLEQIYLSQQKNEVYEK